MSNTDQAPEPSMEEILSSIRRIISDDNESSSADEDASVASPDEPEAAEVIELAVEELPAEETGEADPDWGLEEMETETVEEVSEPVSEPAPEPVSEDDDDIFELTNIVEIEELPSEDKTVEDALDLAEPEIELADSGADVEDDIEFVDVDTDEPEIMALPELGPEPVFDTEETAVPGDDDRLVSEGAGMAAASSFGDLANMLLSRGNSASTLEELVQEMLRPMLKSWLDDNLPTLVENLVSEEIERIARRGR